jgi:hypothetical protein
MGAVRALWVHDAVGPDGLRLDDVPVPPPDVAAVRVAVAGEVVRSTGYARRDLRDGPGGGL